MTTETLDLYRCTAERPGGSTMFVCLVQTEGDTLDALRHFLINIDRALAIGHAGRLFGDIIVRLEKIEP